MCTGRVDMAFVLRAFQKGADGVIIGGCWLGECHYVTEGNYDALSMMHLCKKLLEHKGVNPERLRIEWISASEGNRFAEVMNDFTAKLRELGPLGESDGLNESDRESELAALSRLVPYIKMVKREKLAQRLENEHEYEELYTSDEINTLFREVVSYHIEPDKCLACMICLRKCPTDAVEGGKNRIHVIHQDKCIKCGTCLEVCPPRFGAVRVTSGEPVPLPIPEEERAIVREKEGSPRS